MTADSGHEDGATLSDTAEHLAEARQRARKVLGAETHLGRGTADDWRCVLVSIRDTLVLLWVMSLALQGFGYPSFTPYMLVVMAIAQAMLIGISAGRSIHAQVQYYAAELDRERAEIRDHFEDERQEVRAIYAAKGFHEPLLGQIVDTLSADDDRLLKVMMEEELGLSMHHVPHPLMVGLWNFSATLIAGLLLTVPAMWLTPAAARIWLIVCGLVLLAVVAIILGRSTSRGSLEFLTASLLMAGVSGGVVFLLAQWLSRFLEVPPAVPS